MRYNVARNPIGTVHSAPLSSAPGKEICHPILSMLAIHGGQVKRERERERERGRPSCSEGHGRWRTRHRICCSVMAGPEVQ